MSRSMRIHNQLEQHEEVTMGGYRQEKTVIALLSSLLFLGWGLAYGDVVVIGHPGLKPGQLTKGQVSELFLGKTTALPDGTQVKVVDQKDGSVVKDEFYQAVAGKTPDQLKAYWAKIVFTGKGMPPEALAGDKPVKERVAATPGTLGHVN